MRAATPSTKAVDRVLGVLVAVCASAVLVAIGARAGSSITTLLRLTYTSTTTNINRGKRKNTPRSNRRGKETRGSSDGAEGEGGEDDDDEDGGDAYFAYAHGSRSCSSTNRAAEAAGDLAGGAGAEGMGGIGDRGGKLVLHLGSCHCGGLMFEVDAPEHLVAIEGPSKVRYPFITVPAENFRLTSDDSNGSLYLLKCRPSAGRDNTPKVSAHFFCRRCGVHVVHAPDFPHAVVADVNVHCIRPSTIKSLAVGFLRGGGAELPGMGDPVEGVYEVEKEQWSDAMRERVTFALQQRPLEDAENVTATSSASHGSTSTSSSRALSPRRRSASAISSASRGLHDGGGVLHEGGGALGTGKVGTTFSGGGESGGVAGMEDGRRRGTSILGGITALGAGGGMRTSDTAATRRGPEREARHHASSSSSSGGGGGSGLGRHSTGNTWGDVLMHVVSLPSSSVSSSSAAAGAATASTAYPRSARQTNSANIKHSNSNNSGSGWGPGTSDMLVRAERDRQVQQQQQQQHQKQTRQGGVDAGVERELLPRTDRRSTDETAGVRVGAGNEGVFGGGRAAEGRRGVVNGYSEDGGSGLRRRRSLSVDSGPIPKAAAVSATRLERLPSEDNAQDVPDGTRSPVTLERRVSKKNDPHDGASVGEGGSVAGEAGGGSKNRDEMGSRIGGGYSRLSREERNEFVRPPSGGGVTGGFAVAKA